MIVTLDNLADIRAKHAGKKIILTSGTFDLFHVGHLQYLTAVKSYGDVVIVLLSGDARVKFRKGPERPIIGEQDRAQILDALKMVDYVLIDPGKPDGNDLVYADILARLQPELYVTDGEDIRFSKIMEKSKQIVLDRVDGGQHASTSAIVEHIKELGRAQ
jgi:rfaE bifunctional protein nucleotidyltransferase chain/domain